MSQLAAPIPVLPTAGFDVYVKAVTGAGDPPEGGLLDSASGSGGGAGGWVYDGYLRFIDARYGAWPRSSTARFERVSLTGAVEPFENGLFDYGIDDQVRVVMTPSTVGTSIGTDPAGLEPTGVVVFEGSLQRASFAVRGDGGGGEDERFRLTAVDAPTMDQLRPEHLVRGRFVARGAEPHLVDGPSLPCVFNAGGRPNMRGGQLFTAEAGGLAEVTCQLFTADADWRATYWTLGHALRHLVCCWLYGLKDNVGGDAQGALPRSCTLEPATYDAVFGPVAPTDPRWAGLDKVLPEVGVQGLGVYDAIERVCSAAGFRLAVTPPLGRAPDAGASIDRLYQLRLWRAGAGPANALRLRDRLLPDDSASAQEELAANNVAQLSGLRDATRVRNHVIATGRTLIEVTVPLLPMWSPADMAALGGALGPRHQARPGGQDGEAYHQRHVAGGKLAGDYAHVGRLWGLDETGGFADASLGYQTGPYTHPAGGFDWLAHLGIDGSDGLSLARQANGVTDPIRWAQQTRRPLHLTDPASVAVGRRFRLDVSEDGGGSWFELPEGAAAVVRDGLFGIKLAAENLATVSRATYGAGGSFSTAEAAASWWQLILDEQLRFRLTCLVEADHAARFDAPRDPATGTRYSRVLPVQTRVTEVWRSPSSVLGDQATWVLLDDGGVTASAAGPDRNDNLRDLAERLRDERGQARLSVAAGHWLMDPALFAIGDTITGVVGRNVDFSLFASGSGKTRYPAVVSVSITGYPEQGQGIAIDIGDEAVRRGV